MRGESVSDRRQVPTRGTSSTATRAASPRRPEVILVVARPSETSEGQHDRPSFLIKIGYAQPNPKQPASTAGRVAARGLGPTVATAESRRENDVHA
jgi:hypothetical protein